MAFFVEHNNEEVETTGEQTRGTSAWAGRATPPTAGFPMQNTSHVKFEPPSCPVIFVLGKLCYLRYFNR